MEDETMSPNITVLNGEHPNVTQSTQHLNSIASHVMETISEEDFIAAYKRVFEVFQLKEDINTLKGSSAEARKLQSKLADSFKKKIAKSITDMYIEENLNESFCRIDQLKANEANSKNNFEWRPPGDAEKHMNPFELASTIELKELLSHQLTVEQENLNSIKLRLDMKRKAIQEIKASMKKDICEFEKLYQITI